MRKAELRLQDAHIRFTPLRCDRGARRTIRPVHLNQPTILQQLAGIGSEEMTKKFRQQVAALCFRWVENKLEVLLVTSRGSGRWIIPKGWPIRGKTLGEAALTEAWEEAGVTGIVTAAPIGRYTYLKERQDGKVVPCCVDVYPVEMTSVADSFKERGQRRCAWVDQLEAARRVRELELKSLLAGFKPSSPLEGGE